MFTFSLTYLQEKNEALFLLSDKESNEFLLSKVICSYNSAEKCHIAFSLAGVTTFWYLGLSSGSRCLPSSEGFQYMLIVRASVSPVQMSLHVTVWASCCNMKMSLQIALWSWSGNAEMSLLCYELLQKNLSFLMELALYFANTLLTSLSVGLTSLEQHTS